MAHYIQKFLREDPYLEVEMRLSKSKGINADEFAAALKTISQWSEGMEVVPAQTYVHFFYTLPDQKKETFRTTTIYDEDTMVQTTTTTSKTQKVQIKIATNTDYKLKFSIAKEEPIPESRLDFAVLPHFVRFCIRTSFLYTPRQKRCPMWRYDFTQVWEGPSLSQVEKNIYEGMPAQNEIEVELIDPWSISQNSDIALALHLMKKCLDFLVLTPSQREHLQLWIVNK